MILSHSIRLDPTEAQIAHFLKASGTARFAWNWALARWNERHEAGEKFSARDLRDEWNKVRPEQFPWSFDVTKCCSAQAILDLGQAFKNFFRDLAKPKGARRFRRPKFKKKGQTCGFALWSDQIVVRARTDCFGKIRSEVKVPLLGWVKAREALRLDGTIKAARIKRDAAGRWSVSVQVEFPDPVKPHVMPGSIVGVDLGVTTLMTLSQPLPDGATTIENPKALNRHMKKLRRQARRVSRQEEARKARGGKISRRAKLARTNLALRHARIASIRTDAIHKATARIAGAFETVVIEDLNVSGLVKNHALARSVQDAAFGEIRRQFEYKTLLRGGSTRVVDRFFPSSKLCSTCSARRDKLPLQVRTWTCKACGSVHDRDENASINLERYDVGPAKAQTVPHRGESFCGTTRGEIMALAEESIASTPQRNQVALNREPSSAYL